MKQIISFFLLYLLLAPFCTIAQSLGDPVINETFGSGTGAGAPLASSVTNYTYTNSQCPADGSYTINSITAGCFTDTWHTLSNDHTGNSNGYMMIINASSSPGVFYVQRAEASKLCPSTTYQFAAWVLNILKNSSCGTGAIQPNITFSIETAAGVVLKTYNTGDIPATPTPAWNQYATYFTTPATPTDIVVKMTNNAQGGCGNDLVLDDITFRASGPVLTPAFSSGNTSQTLCEGDNATLNINTGVSPGYSDPKFQWQRNVNNTGWTDIAGAIATTYNPVFVSATPGSYQYRLAVGEGANITNATCRTYSSALTVSVGTNPVVTLTAPVTVCEGNLLQLAASGGATYQWSGPNGFTSTLQNPVINNISAANAGTYAVTVYSSLGCPATASKNVQVSPKPTGTVSADLTICEGTSTVLTARGGVSYGWVPLAGVSDPASATPTVSPTATTAYTVRIYNAAGCYDEKTVVVTVLPKPVADAGPNKVLFEGQSAKINATALGSSLTYSWSPIDGLDDPTSLTPTVNPTNDITYTLTVTTDNGCGISTDDVFVKVYKKVNVPNTFSPNNDGINDNWNIEALVTYPNCTINVYNRYGEQVYESKGYTKSWTGIYNGKPIPAGTYYYVIDLKNGTPKLNGWVAIVR